MRGFSTRGIRVNPPTKMVKFGNFVRKTSGHLHIIPRDTPGTTPSIYKPASNIFGNPQHLTEKALMGVIYISTLGLVTCL